MATEKIERRRYKRFRVKDGILVSTPTRTGEMLDISMGGLSFRYADGKNLPGDYESAILFGEDELFLEEIPLKMLGDYTNSRETGVQLRIRRIGARFGELNPQQVDLLRDFIHLHSLS